MNEQESTKGFIVVECLCGCHKGKGGMIHFRACCQGMCKKCGRWFEYGLEEHKQTCDGIKEPICQTIN